MTLNLKIEILKVFSIVFSLSSNKELKFKKDKTDEIDSAPVDSTSAKQPSKS
jgi:hypothetical protein